MNGTVALYQIGRTRTRIVVRIPQGGNYALSLYPGSDCADNIEQVRSAIALAPINTAAANAPESQTIVEVPIEKLQSDNYVIDVRNAIANILDRHSLEDIVNVTLRKMRRDGTLVDFWVARSRPGVGA